MLISAKVLLGIDPNQHDRDQLLNAYCELMSAKVMNYCNIQSIPPQLKTIVAEMAAALYKKLAGANQQSAASGSIKKETVGNHTIEYVTEEAPASSNVTGSILNDYQMQLNPFRRVKFI